MSDDISSSENFRFSDGAYKDPEVLEELVEGRGLTLQQTAEVLNVSTGTVLRYLKIHQIAGRGVDIDVPDQLERPWEHKGFMRRVYVEEENSLIDLALAIGKSSSFTKKWLQRHGIDVRGIREAQYTSSSGHRNWVRFETDRYGHENWRISIENKDRRVAVHRLLAASKFGFNALKGKRVHHKNEIPWDNRPDNLELLTHAEHRGQHEKMTWLDKLRVTELYENGDVGYRKIAEQFPVSWGTIRRAHREVVNIGGDGEDNPETKPDRELEQSKLPEFVN